MNYITDEKKIILNCKKTFLIIFFNLAVQERAYCNNFLSK